MKKYIFFLVIVIYEVILCKCAMAVTYNLSGNVQEKINMDEVENVPLNNFKLELVNADNNEKIDETTTDGNGEFLFSNIKDTIENYKVKFQYPNVTEDDINGISTISEAKKIQKKLKYNCQDYVVGSEKTIGSAIGEKKEDAVVWLVLDVTGSMRENNKIELLKKMARKIVNDLLKEDENIQIGIITFNTDAYTARQGKQELTNNKDTLLKEIRKIKAAGDTNINPALEMVEKRFNDSNAKNKVKYMYILTDGISEDRDQARDKIRQLKKNNINIYTALIGDPSEWVIAWWDNNESTPENFLKDSNVFKIFKDMNQNEFNNFVENFIQNVRIRLEFTNAGYDYIESNPSDTDLFNNSFQYSNTLFYKAIDMKIGDESEVKTFKKYARSLIKNIQITGESKVITTKIENEGNDDDLDKISIQEFKNGKLSFYLVPRLQYTLKPSMQITRLKVQAQNGMVILDESLEQNRLSSLEGSDTIIGTLDESLIYGSKSEVSYEIQIKSVSDSNTKVLWIISYLPGNIEENNFSNLCVNGVLEGETEISFDKGNFKYLLLNADSVKNPNMKDIVAGEVIDYIKAGNLALMLQINIEKQKDFSLEKNSIIKITYDTENLNTYEQNYFNSSMEILAYKNENLRRLQYDSATAVAGNHHPTNNSDTEKDYAISNSSVILPPTGQDKSLLSINKSLINTIFCGICIIIIHLNLNYICICNFFVNFVDKGLKIIYNCSNIFKINFR